MGFPIQRIAGRATLIAVMLGGGMLYAGISQAQDANNPAERASELAAATGGPAPADHLIAFAHDATAVDAREDDVESSAVEPASPASGAPDDVVSPPKAQPVAYPSGEHK